MCTGSTRWGVFSSNHGEQLDTPDNFLFYLGFERTRHSEMGSDSELINKKRDAYACASLENIPEARMGNTDEKIECGIGGPSRVELRHMLN